MNNPLTDYIRKVYGAKPKSWEGDNEIYRERLRLARICNNKTMQEAVTLAGIDKDRLIAMEVGEYVPSKAEVRHMANLYQVDQKWLGVDNAPAIGNKPAKFRLDLEEKTKVDAWLMRTIEEQGNIQSETVVDPNAPRHVGPRPQPLPGNDRDAILSQVIARSPLYNEGFKERKHDAETLRAACLAYFEWCVENKSYVAINGLLNYIGVTKARWDSYMTSSDSNIAAVAQFTFQMLTDYTEMMGIEGHIDARVYQWLEKTRAGYVPEVMHTIQMAPPQLTLEEINARAASLPQFAELEGEVQ